MLARLTGLIFLAAVLCSEVDARASKHAHKHRSHRRRKARFGGKDAIAYKPLPILEMPCGKVTYYKIPKDTFRDPIEGSTRNLTLDMVPNKYNMPYDLWYDLNNETQQIYAIPVLSDFPGNSQGLHEVELIAKNSNGTKRKVVIKIHSTFPEHKADHEYSFVLDPTEDALKLTSDVNSRLKLVRSLARLWRIKVHDIFNLNVKYMLSSSIEVTFAIRPIDGTCQVNKTTETYLGLYPRTYARFKPVMEAGHAQFVQSVMRPFVVSWIRCKPMGTCPSKRKRTSERPRSTKPTTKIETESPPTEPTTLSRSSTVATNSSLPRQANITMPGQMCFYFYTTSFFIISYL